jgi:hypothetical protein
VASDAAGKHEVSGDYGRLYDMGWRIENEVCGPVHNEIADT